MNIKEKVIEGYTFSLLSYAIYFAALFFTRVFIYRLLTSGEIGLYNIIIAILGITGVFQGFGLITATIQLEESNEAKVITSGFILIVLVASTAFLLILIFGKALSLAFDEPLVTKILPYLLFFHFIEILGLPPLLAAYRKLTFKPVYISGIIKDTVGIISSLLLAFFGFGVWSLVFGICVSFVLKFCLSWTYILSASHLKIDDVFTFSHFSFPLTRKLLKVGIPLLVGIIIFSILQNSISLTIGILLNATAVGYYTAAFFFIGPIETIIRAFSSVTFSAFSRIQNSQDSIQRGINRFLRYTALLVMPCFIILLVIGDKIILFILGTQWTPAAHIVWILAVIPLIIPFGRLGRSVLVSIGETSKIAIANSFRVVIFLGTAIILTPYLGLMGIALAITFQYGVLLYYPLALNRRYRFIHEIVRNYKKPLLTLPASGVILFFLRPLITHVFILGLIVAFSFGLFFIFLYILEGSRLIKDLKELFQEIKGTF